MKKLIKQTLNKNYNCKHHIKNILIIISAFIPYIANECWEKITKNNDLTSQEWPKIDESILHKERSL